MNDPLEVLVPVVELESTQQRILIVEDEPDIRALITFVLERAGYDVVCVKAVGEAQAAISLYDFDAAVVDLCLPDGYGDEIMGILRATSPQTRIVQISALAATDGIAQNATVFADAFLPKPFTNAALVAAVAIQPVALTSQHC